MWTIKESVLINAITAANNYLPAEFVCLLGGDKKNKIITEIVFVPSQTSEDAATINTYSIPFDDSILGSLHSHPFSSNGPSSEDKRFFAKYSLNIILGYPFNKEKARFFDEHGKKTQILITEG